MKNPAIEKTKRAIFEKYPNAVIFYAYDWGEILFYANKEQAGNEDDLHGAFLKNRKLIDERIFE